MPTVEEATTPLAVAREWLRKNEVKTIYEEGVGVGTKTGSETTGPGRKGQERLWALSLVAGAQKDWIGREIFHTKEMSRASSDTEGDASKVETKNGSTVCMLTSGKTKRDPFCDQKSMLT